MRKLLSVFVLVALAFCVAATANAEKLAWKGALSVVLNTLPPAVVTGSGSATVNNSQGLGHLNTLRIAGGISGRVVTPVTDPDVAPIVELDNTFIIGSGVIDNISGALQNTSQQLSNVPAIPIAGLARVCLVFQGCNSGSIEFGLTTNDGNTGFGVGGLITAGQNGQIRISLLNAPWTIKTVTLSRRSDALGLEFPTAKGFAHGPASMTSSTALTSGVVQLVNPTQVITFGIPGEVDRSSLFSKLTIHFVPEPGMLLLLGSGVAGLAVLGRMRMKK